MGAYRLERLGSWSQSNMMSYIGQSNLYQSNL
jgi:hypothetical protein